MYPLSITLKFPARMEIFNSYSILLGGIMERQRSPSSPIGCRASYQTLQETPNSIHLRGTKVKCAPHFFQMNKRMSRSWNNMSDEFRGLSWWNIGYADTNFFLESVWVKIACLYPYPEVVTSWYSMSQRNSFYLPCPNIPKWHYVTGYPIGREIFPTTGEYASRQ